MRLTLRTLLLLMAVVIACGRPPAPDEAARAVAVGVFRQIETKNFERLTDEFYSPDETRRNIERRWLRRSLQLLEQRFGTVRIVAPYRGVPNDYFVAVGAGNLEFWDAHQEAERYTVEAIFARKGRGWVHVDITRAGGDPKVKVLMYGIPQEIGGAQQFIGDVLREAAAQPVQ